MQKSACYKLLGLEPGASRHEIRKRYRQLAMRYHPDKNPDPDAEKLFIKLTEAYEILLGKRPESAATTKPENRKASHEERMKTAHVRFADQKIRQTEENDRYFNYLTKGRKWKTIRVSAILGSILTLCLLLDLVLPHHFEREEITHYRLNVGAAPNGKDVGLIRTASERSFFVSQMRYSLYNKDRYVLVESSWIFHNPVRIISLGKVENNPYNIHFTLYGTAWLIILLLMLPVITMQYKRKSVSFTILYHASYFGTNAVILVYLITGHRWAHLLTLGFL